MVNAAGTKSITFVASGDVLDEIKRRTASGDVTNNRAALDLIEAGMRAPAPPAEAPAAELSLDALLDLLRARFDERPDQSAELAAAIERAEAVEARVLELESALASVTQILTSARAVAA